MYYFDFRTKLDWSLPKIPQANRAVKEIANIYLEGAAEHDLPKHAVPILGDRARYRMESKVIKRNRLADARLNFLK